MVACTVDDASGGQPQANPGAMSANVPASLVFAVTYYWSGRGAAYLGPRGWRCTGQVGGNNTSVFEIRHPADKAGRVTYIDAAMSYGYILEIACPLFPEAGRSLQADFGTACAEPPAAEVATPVSPTIVRFTDPAKTRGTGDGSGGAYPTTGAIFWDGNTALKVSCALPPDQAGVCDAVIGTFIDSIGGG